MPWSEADEYGTNGQEPASGGARTRSGVPRTGGAQRSERFGGPLVDIEELAPWLGTSTRHVRRLVHERRVPYVKIGHYVRFDRTDVTAWLELQKVSVVAEQSVDGEPLWLRRSPVRDGETRSASTRRRPTPVAVNREPPWLRARNG